MVRFTPAAQRFAWARHPANSFGWVGSGQLQCDAHGVHIDGRRMTLLGPRHLRQTLGAGQIRDVYREGAVIQMHLRSGARRAVIRLWALDAAQATQLVARLPTQRTIEVEAAPAAVQVPRPPRCSPQHICCGRDCCRKPRQRQRRARPPRPQRPHLPQRRSPLRTCFRRAWTWRISRRASPP
jgi:hypothetical protein